MIEESIEIRAAKPIYAEGLIAAKFIKMSNEALVPTALGSDYRQVVASAFTQPDNDFSFQNTVFAEHKGSIVGMALGFTGAKHAASSDLPIRNAPGKRLRRTIGLSVLNLFVRMMGGYPEKDFYIAFLGVDESYRGKGIGTKLLIAMEDMAREQHADRLALHVEGDNSNAKRLYEAFGMKIEQGGKKKGFLQGIGGRMVKELESRG